MTIDFDRGIIEYIGDTETIFFDARPHYLLALLIDSRKW